MINIEQNAIIKIFSVLAGVFLPPILIASIYGMNFESMPKLDETFGYPMALLLMLASAGQPVPVLQAPRLAVNGAGRPRRPVAAPAHRRDERSGTGVYARWCGRAATPASRARSVPS